MKLKALLLILFSGSNGLMLMFLKILIFCIGWPKSLFRLFRKMVRRNPNELFGQPNRYKLQYLWMTQ